MFHNLIATTMYLIKKITSRNEVKDLDLALCFKLQKSAKAYLKGMIEGLVRQGTKVDVLTATSVIVYTECGMFLYKVVKG
nr:MAG TPA_asm: hypothetical protein [Caudoviricetes sp.]